MSTSPFSIKLNKIVAIDSASFAYVEVPLNRNIVLLGTGNLGKSSLVNAVRFFFLPDINVNDADKKFGFISGANDSSDVTYFSKDQIYNHYFPTDDSRLILEVEHQLVDGSIRHHCQVISRGGNYRSLRTFIPESYATIEHLFWNKSSVAGIRPAKKPGAQLLTQLKKINQSTKQFHQVEQLIEALYSVNILRPDLCPFVIFPITDIRTNSVNSIRALVKMLFNQDSSSLRLMTSSAIEAKESTSQVLELDIGEIINEQRMLKDRKANLDKLKSIEPQFVELQHQYAKISKEQDAANQFAINWAAISSVKRSFEAISGKIGEQKASVQTELNRINHNCSDIEKKIYSHEQRLKEINKKLAHYTNHQEACERVCQPYFNLSQTEILEILKEEYVEVGDKLKHYTDQSARTAKIGVLDIEIEQKSKYCNTLTKKAENASYSLKEQLHKSIWDKLHSVNPLLAKANPGRNLIDSEISAIGNFAELLKRHDSHLDFFDETIPLLSEASKYSLEGEIDDVEAEISKLKQERQELASLSDSQTAHDAKTINSLRQNMELLHKDIQLLEDLPTIKRLEHDLIEEKNTKEEELKGYKESHESISNKRQGLLDRADELKSQLEEKQQTIRKIDELTTEFSFVATRFKSVKFALDEATETAKVDEPLLPDRESLFVLTQQLEAAERAKANIYIELCKVVTAGIIQDSHGLLTGNSSDNEIIDTFASLSEQFALLEQNQDVLARDTINHNAHVRNRLERLNKTKDKVDITISEINSELASAKVNDLEAVKLDVTLNAHFNDLISSWREFDDLTGDGTLPDEWYVRLQRFLHSDAVNQKDGKLRMDNIIQMAKYQTKKKDAPWDDKDQSTSTKMLINMHLCDIFIQQLSSDTSHIAFPLIMDEVGKVSSEQFPELIKGLNQKGHWLIGVTTHGKSGDLIAPFSHHLVMDEVKTSQPYNKTRRNVCFPLDRVEGLVIKDQAELLENSI